MRYTISFFEMLQFLIHSDISESPKDDELYFQSKDFNVLRIIKKCTLEKTSGTVNCKESVVDRDNRFPGDFFLPDETKNSF
jgi:hypothetical protein